VICSLVPGRSEGRQDPRANSEGIYGKWASEVARSENVPFIDLNETIAREYDRLGAAKVDGTFLR